MHANARARRRGRSAARARRARLAGRRPRNRLPFVARAAVSDSSASIREARRKVSSQLWRVRCDVLTELAPAYKKQLQRAVIRRRGRRKCVMSLCTCGALIGACSRPSPSVAWIIQIVQGVCCTRLTIASVKAVCRPHQRRADSLWSYSPGRCRAERRCFRCTARVGNRAPG